MNEKDARKELIEEAKRSIEDKYKYKIKDIIRLEARLEEAKVDAKVIRKTDPAKYITKEEGSIWYIGSGGGGGN